MELDFMPVIIARFHFPERLLLSISHVNLFQINPSIYIHASFSDILFLFPDKVSTPFLPIPVPFKVLRISTCFFATALIRH